MLIFCENPQNEGLANFRGQMFFSLLDQGQKLLEI